MPSPEFEAILQFLRQNPTPEDIPLAQRRRTARRMALQTPLPAGTYAEEMALPGPDENEIPALLLAAAGANDDEMILYLHGGGYVQGSIPTHRDLAARLSAKAATRVLLIEYRLAPEHPFPAAVRDATAAYRWLRENGVDAARLLVGGDSAGGGLALATLLALRDEGERLPAAAFALSPWVDLSLSGGSLQRNAATDPSLTRQMLADYAAMYLGDADPETPLASPLFADLSGLPPLFLQAGAAEILLDDALRLAEAAEAAGVTVTGDVWPEMIHGWQGFAGVAPEAEQALYRVGQFVRRVLADSGAQGGDEAARLD